MRRPPLAPVAILVAVLVVLAAVVLAAGPAQGDQQDPSSTSSGQAGTLALYDWLGAMGYGVRRAESSFDLSATDVLVSADPESVNPYSQSDLGALRSFLDRGGLAILAVGDPTAVAVVLAFLGVDVQPATLTSADPSQPFPGSAGVAGVPLVAPGAPEAGTAAGAPVWSFLGGASLVPLLGEAGASVAATLRVGSGRIDLLGSEYPLSNDGLRRGGSAALVLSLLQEARGRSVAFDEFHHLPPLGADDYGLSAVLQGPLLAAVLLAALVILVLLLSGGRRLGRPLPPRDPTRVPSVLEHIAAVGHLVARSRERGEVAARYAEELKLRVGRVTGVEPQLSDDQFATAIAGFGEERARQASQVLARARSLAASRPGEAALVALAREVDLVEEGWGATALR